MQLEKLSVRKIYNECLRYCQTCECPRLSEDEKASCIIYSFCDKSFFRNHKRIPVLIGTNLEKAYERIKRGNFSKT